MKIKQYDTVKLKYGREAAIVDGFSYIKEIGR